LYGLVGLFEYCKIVEYKVLISFWDLVVCDGTIVDLLLDAGFFEWGLFDIFIFSDLSSPLIYPPGPMRWSEHQVLVDVGREHANVIFFAYKFRILKLFAQMFRNLSEPMG
jgi:hypothetical protein